MSTQETYELDGSTRFDFPHPVRDPQQLTVEVHPGNVVPPSDYEVVGYGPNATGVTVYYPDAPSDPDLELRITRYTEPERVTRFSDGTPVQPKALDAEFDNLFQLYVDMPNYVQLAENWASEEEDTEVEDGKYSAYHWAQKAKASEDSANESEDAAATSESNAKDSENAAAASESNAKDSEGAAASYRDKAEEWAEAPEDEEVESGKYSARHHSAKAEGYSSDASDSASDAASSASDASDSASAAATSESNAKDSEDAARTSELNAKDSEDAAATSESNAKESEDQAKKYKEDTSDLHESVQDTVDQFESGYTGFDEDHGYDFGYVTDETTYFDRDFGTIA